MFVGVQRLRELAVVSGREEEEEVVCLVVVVSKIGLQIREVLAPRSCRNPCLQIFAKAKVNIEWKNSRVPGPSICQFKVW